MSAPTVQPARAQVLALAATARPDLDPHHLAGVLDDRRYDRLGHVRVQQEATRVIYNGGDLRDLRATLDAALLVHGGH